MESYIAEWLNLLFRWLHLITGAAWIGTSFYFNWLNHNLRPPSQQSRKDEGIDGELFAVHGGHFYQVSKYGGAPEKLPETLHWFKWEAYFTWITGFSLLSIVYYWGARAFLIDPSVMPWEHTWQPIALSISTLVGGWLVYDLLCKSPLGHKPLPFAVVGFSLMTCVAYALTQVLAARAAYINVGAMLGTMMAANVFFVIIPNQRKMVDAMSAGLEPDIELGAEGAQRSLHNNYFTLPVLFIMLSNHYSMTTYGHEWNWAILAALSLIGAGARHYFNLKHKGQHKQWILPVAALAMVSLAFVTKPAPIKRVGNANSASETQLYYSDIQPILEKHCVSCHMEPPNNPLWPMPTPPKGINLSIPLSAKNYASQIMAQAVNSKTMPLANQTKMTDEERVKLGQWIQQGALLDGEKP